MFGVNKRTIDLVARWCKELVCVCSCWFRMVTGLSRIRVRSALFPGGRPGALDRIPVAGPGRLTGSELLKSHSFLEWPVELFEGLKAWV